MAVVLVVLVVLAFFPCLRNDFVDSWDDDKNFLNNLSYRGLGWSQLVWDWTSFQLGVYQPLAWMILGAEYLLFGLQPWGYHLASLVLYALDTVVLFVLVLTLLIRCRPGWEKEAPGVLVLAAGLAVALFAVHPLRTEVVAWASCQPYLPCALFAMLTVLAYLRAFPADAAPRRDWFWAAFGLFAAALLSKAVAVSLPLVLLILDVYPLRRLGGGPGRWFGPAVRRVWWEKAPFVALSVLFMGLAVHGRVQEHHLAPVQDFGVAARIAQACYGIGFYVLKALVPWNLTAYYPIPERVVWYELPYVGYIVGTVAVSVAVYLLRRRWPGLLAVWLSYLVILAPNLGLVRIGGQIAADRYSYIAMMGVVVLAAAGLVRVFHLQVARRAWPVAAVGSVASVGVLLTLIVLNWGQCQIWRTSEVLWRHALAHGASRSCIAHNNLGADLARRGRLAEADAEYLESLRLDPTYAPAHVGRGAVLGRQGRLAEAEAEYTESLRLDPTYAPAHLDQGVLFERQGRLLEAEAEYRESLRLDPTFALANNNLGALLEKQGRLAEAQAKYLAILRRNPADAAAHNSLGAVLRKQGQLEDARREFSEVLRLNPGDAEAHNNLGLILLRQGRSEEAGQEFSESVRLNPDFAEVHTNLGVVLKAQGRLDEARAEFAAAVRINPGDAQAHDNLGGILGRLGRIAEAQAEFEAALRINPDFADAHYNRGLILLHQGRLDEAGAAFSQALRLKPDYAEAHNNLGVVFLQRGQLDEARGEFSQALRINPAFSGARNNLESIRRAQGW
jgi:tetratricopeptide (TPR) repeat protein